MIEALTLYGDYLMGQMSGMSEALDLGAVVACLTIESIPRSEHIEQIQNVMLIHSQVIKAMKAKHRKAGGG